MSKSIGRVFGTGSMSPYGYETDYIVSNGSFGNQVNYNLPNSPQNNSYNPMRVNDKYKHAMINCLMAQRGAKSEKVSQITSGLKENYDVFMNKNTSKASDEDMEANIYGRNIGRNYPNGNCHELISTKYKP